MNAPEWPAAQIAQLRTLWAEGHSTAEIGRRLGVSKNAVIGKTHRLPDLPRRPSPIRRADPNAVQVIRARHPRDTLPPLPVPLTPRQNAGFGRRPAMPAPVVSFPTVVVPPSTKTCQWPLSDGRPWRFCGSTDMVPGRSYCCAHARVAYRAHAEMAEAAD